MSDKITGGLSVVKSFKSTEQLEAELRSVSEQVEEGKRLFHDIREELARRRAAKDEQPTQQAQPEDAADNLLRQVRVMSLKVIAMEAEQAKLAVEVEVAKAAQREAERRLSLIARLHGRDIPARHGLDYVQAEDIAIAQARECLDAAEQVADGDPVPEYLKAARDPSWKPHHWVVLAVMHAYRVARQARRVPMTSDAAIALAHAHMDAFKAKFPGQAAAEIERVVFPTGQIPGWIIDAIIEAGS